MKNLHVHCLAFNDFPMVKRAIEQFESQKGNYPIKTKLLVDQQWPCRTVDEDTQSGWLMQLAFLHGWRYVKPFKNRGVGTWNWVIQELELGEDDVLHGCDPDGNPQQPGYLDAMMDVFNNAPECYTVQLNRKEGEYLVFPKTELTKGATTVLDFNRPVAWSLGAFSVSWLKRIGGFLQFHPQYGFCEIAIIDKAKPLGGKFYILKDFYDEHLKSTNEPYIKWKRACADNATQLDFATWLQFYA